jgi:PAS domain S-box-containing protein
MTVSKVAKENGAATTLERLLEIVPDAMLAIKPPGEVAFANQEAATLFGYAHRELIGKPLDMLVRAPFTELHGVDTAKYFDDPINGKIHSGLTLPALRRNGEEFLAEIRHSHVEDGDLLLLTIRDIGDRARTQAPAQITDRDFRRLIVNRAVAGAAGTQPTELNGNGDVELNGNGDTEPNGNGDMQMTVELRASRQETVERLAMAVELRDPETGRHVNRIGAIGAFLGYALGFDDERAELLLAAAPMHDVGKIGISDEILLKRGKLTRSEREEIQRHTTIGHELLAGSTSEFLRLAATIALTHHEHWDGSGYPQGLAGDEIPLEGRIVAVADVFDALLSDRPYRPALSVDVALTEIREGLGSHFDPRIAQILLDHSDAVLELRHGAADLDPPRPRSLSGSRSSG